MFVTQNAKIAFFVIISPLLFGCTLTNTAEPVATEQQTNLINESEQRIIASLTSYVEQTCRPRWDEVVDNQEHILQELQKSAPNKPFEVVQPVCPEIVPEVVVDALNLDNKFLVGEVESLVLKRQKMTINARLDTGAETSSLGIFDLNYFERDGKDWLSFKLSKDADAKRWEYPIKRKIKVFQQGRTQALPRPVVEISFELGDKHFISDFSLADRQHLTYQILLGRSFLKDVAIVDVSDKYLMSQPKA